MSDSTSIFELPTEPAGGSMNQNNISLVAQDLPSSAQQQQSTNNQSVTLDQSVISQIVSGIQQASSTGITQLPSRDIPRNTEAIVNDAQIQPNYIPSPIQTKNTNYIPNNEEMDSMIYKYNKEKNKSDSLDEIYSEIQSPLLLAVLYFLFQLPFFKKILFNYFPILFSKDGNQNIHGYLFMSILFGLLFFFITKLSYYFTSSYDT